MSQIKRFNEQQFFPDKSNNDIVKVKAVQDDSSHWYVIPNSLFSDFNRDVENEAMCDSGEFGNKYGQYMTGGDLNQIQLYAKF